MVDSNLLGWHKDKFDYRDFIHEPQLVKIPDNVLLADLLTPIRNQGNVGSCVGHGIGVNINSVLKKLGLYTEWQSPTWYYNGARFIEGTLTIDNGCEPGDALDWALKSGTLLEKYWVYDPNNLDKSAPSSARLAQAVKYTNFAYFRVTDGVNGICSALADGHFVSLGTPWFDKWFDAPNGILANVTTSDSVAGGHETCLYGYDLLKSVFYGINSWGTDWGDKGFYIMPFDAISIFKSLGGYDAHYVTFDATIEPNPNPPTPDPEPSKCKWGNSVAKAMNVAFMQGLRGREGRFYYGNPPKEKQGCLK